MTSHSTADDKTIDKRIQSLPQELQDWIKELLIAQGLPASGIVLDDKRLYRPPHSLQIDHKTRERFAKELYKTGVAVDVGETTCSLLVIDRAYALMGQWTNALSKPHRELVETFLFDLTTLQRVAELGWFKQWKPEFDLVRLYIMVEHGLIGIKTREEQADGSHKAETAWETPQSRDSFLAMVKLQGDWNGYFGRD